MCGLAGIAPAPGVPLDTAALERMAAALAHRGPDGSHVEVLHGVGLAHTRLAIIDLAGGDQPLRCDTAALVANGEIYNDPALRAELAGAPFRTRSDCEAPLFLWPRDGLDFPQRLRGMYAVALVTDDGSVVLARDPFGIKPLYVAEGPWGVAFASEPQALIASGLVAATVEPAARDELFQLQFTTGARTIFRGIRRLLPGETLRLRDGRIAESRRRPALPDEAAEIKDPDTALDLLDEALTNAVHAHQRSDVPYGMFLSGGIDSSVVLGLMARLNPEPVLAFTAGFPGTGVHDERDHARELARTCGAEHVEVAVSEADFWDHLPAIAAAMDDPAADYAIVPTWILAREARKAVKVILSGEGGDELFAGYGRYRGAMRPWPFTRAMRRKGTFDGLGVLRAAPTGWRDGIAAAEAEAKQRFRSRLTRAQAVDVADWLPNDLLTKLDRCLMAHGVEGRVPFLDPVVAEVAMRLPESLRLGDGQGKIALRRWLDRHLPQARPFAPKKGFTVPVGEWIAARGAELAPLVVGAPGVAEVVTPDAAGLFTATGKRQRFAAWTLTFYALWYRRHVLGDRAEGGVFDVLTSKP